MLKIAILGFGREGKAVFKYLHANARPASPLYCSSAVENPTLNSMEKGGSPESSNQKLTITILDQNPELELPKNTSSILGPDYLKHLADFDVVFRSPGIPFNLPEIQAAVRLGVQFSSATKLFCEIAEARNDFLLIGVTGTKGKGTTATLLYEILKTAGRDVHLAGNIGRPALDILPKLAPSPNSNFGPSAHTSSVTGKNSSEDTLVYSSEFLPHHNPKSEQNGSKAYLGTGLLKGSIAILELSSFQLHDLDVSPPIAVVLDVFPDHMDSHSNFEEYVAAKTNIARYQKSDDKIFYAADNIHAAQIAQAGAGQKIAVTTKNFALFGTEDLKIPGPHNLKNAVMAATVARELGVPNAIILKTVKKFRGLPHRLQLVRTLRATISNANRRQRAAKKTIIKFYDDSASTNPTTAAAAIKSFTEPLVLLAGGKDKKISLEPLVKAAQESPHLKVAVLFGENKEALKIALTPLINRGLKVEVAADLRSAVDLAHDQALKLIADGGTTSVIILLSPAAASFDMFRDYADRGDQFKKIVKNLKWPSIPKNL